MAVIYSNNKEYRKWYSLLKSSDENNDLNSDLYDSLASSVISTDKTKNDKTKYRSRSLLDDHPSEFITSELIIHVITPYGSRSILNPQNYVSYVTGERASTLFQTHIEFTKFQLKVPADKRFFFETALGDHAQKPHFDIDINRPDNPDIDGGDVIDDLIDAILIILSADDVEIVLERDILLMISHGINKWSYHLVIDHYLHLNNKESKAFYKKVIALMTPEYAKFIDPAVYGSKQQFRIIYNQKPGSGRIKVFCEQWDYHGDLIEYKYINAPRDDSHKMLLQLEASLLTVVNNCIPMPTYIKEENTQQTSNYSNDVFLPITKDIGKNAVALLAEQGGMTPRDPKFPYFFTGISESFVILKRRKASICRICNRVHEHENPYLLIIGEKQSVYFCCRRNPKKWYLGNLKNDATRDDNSPIKSTSPDTSLYQTSSHESSQLLSNVSVEESQSLSNVSVEETTNIEIVRNNQPDISIDPNISNTISQLAQSSDTGRKPLSVGERVTASTEIDFSKIDTSAVDKYQGYEIDPYAQFHTEKRIGTKPLVNHSVNISSELKRLFNWNN